MFTGGINAGEVYKLKTSKIPKGHPLSPDPFQHSYKEERGN